MENRASKNRSANIAFVLTPDLLKLLAGILREASAQLEFTVKFADGVSVDYTNVEQIIDKPNSEHRSIVGLRERPEVGLHQSMSFLNLNSRQGKNLQSSTR